MLAQFDKSQCFSFPDKPAQVRRFFAFIAPGYAGASGTVVVSQQVCKYQFVLFKVVLKLFMGLPFCSL